jgi:hypothetical protein
MFVREWRSTEEPATAGARRTARAGARRPRRAAFHAVVNAVLVRERDEDWGFCAAHISRAHGLRRSIGPAGLRTESRHAGVRLIVLGVPDINSQHPRKPVGVIACVSLTDSAELNRTLIDAHAVGIFALGVNGLVDDYVVLSRQRGLLSFGTGQIESAEPSGRRGRLKNRFQDFK